MTWPMRLPLEAVETTIAAMVCLYNTDLPMIVALLCMNLEKIRICITSSSILYSE